MISKLNNKLTNQKGNKNAFIQSKSKGFTIIEVVLVLAIAGLIFLIVFLALPGLQRSRRDTQRKSDFNSMAAALENYASNNGGSYPQRPNNGSVITVLLPNFTPTEDPQGNGYRVNLQPAIGRILYIRGGICDEGVATAPAGTPNVYKYAISTVLENGAICKQV